GLQRDVAALFADQHAGRIVDQQPTEDFAFRRHLLRTCDETLPEALQPPCHGVVSLNNKELPVRAVDLRTDEECHVATRSVRSRRRSQTDQRATLSVTR